MLMIATVAAEWATGEYNILLNKEVSMSVWLMFYLAICACTTIWIEMCYDQFNYTFSRPCSACESVCPGWVTVFWALLCMTIQIYVDSGSKPSGPQKFVVSSEGELKSSPAPPPPKPSQVLAQSQAAGMPPTKKPKLLSGTPATSGQQQSSQATGGLFSNPIRLPQQAQSGSNPTSRSGKNYPPGPKSAMQPSTSSQMMPMDGKAHNPNHCK